MMGATESPKLPLLKHVKKRVGDEPFFSSRLDHDQHCIASVACDNAAEGKKENK